MKCSISCVTFLVLASIFSTGCQSLQNSRNPDARPVTHVAICWLKKPGNQEDIKALREASKSLEVIPGVESIDFGTALASNRPVVDDSFDAAVVIRFESSAALAKYAENPVHKRALHEILLPKVKRLLVYDIEHGRP